MKKLNFFKPIKGKEYDITVFPSPFIHIHTKNPEETFETFQCLKKDKFMKCPICEMFRLEEVRWRKKFADFKYMWE